MTSACGVVERIGGALVGLEEQAGTDLGEAREIVEVDAVRGVVLRVVLAAVERARERRDVDPRNAGSEKRPDLGPGRGRREPVAMGEQSVSLGATA